jgi:amidase
MSEEICFMTATDMSRRIRERALSAREVMEAHLARIERVNPVVNAMPTFIGCEAALKLADEADHKIATGVDVGPLHGLPIAHKDTEETAGMRTTWGSPIFKDHVPARDSLMAARTVAAGALRIGKTNVPEWAAGSHTFNPVFGATLNPYDTSKSCGGSSGGAAVCLATGMLPIADGSDLGGSLRNPGNFNNVVGFRPSPGRVPGWPSAMAWQSMAVKGPLARTVEDVALLFSTMAGPDSRAPFALTDSGESFRRPLQRDFTGVRIAWSPDLGGLPVDTRVTAVLESQRQAFEDIGCHLDEATPDFTGAHEGFQTLRAHAFAVSHHEHLRRNRELLKDSVIWNTELGLSLSALDVGKAEMQRTALYERVRVFMETYEFLVCPVNQVLPFPVDVPYPTEINGVAMENYIDWMRSAYYITMTGLPAISVPCGFTPEGLPVGVQIVGRTRDDFGVLQLAHAFEQVTRTGLRRPPVVSQ